MLTSKDYPHRCQDGHPEVGYFTDEQEMCPACFAKAEAEQEIESLKEQNKYLRKARTAQIEALERDAKSARIAESKIAKREADLKAEIERLSLEVNGLEESCLELKQRAERAEEADVVAHQADEIADLRKRLAHWAIKEDGFGADRHYRCRECGKTWAAGQSQDHKPDCPLAQSKEEG